MERHDADGFRNAATFTAAIMYTVAGGARVATARRRGERLAARLADAAARAADTVEVSAQLVRGVHEGLGSAAHPVIFPSANTGLTVSGATGHLWIDPEHELAQRSLAAANAAASALRKADTERRCAVGCRSRLLPNWSCRCVYCRPLDHLEAATVCLDPTGSPKPRCPCGDATERHGRCQLHEHVGLVVLDHDPPELQQLADLEHGDFRPEQP